METGQKITQLKNNINDLSANKLSIQVSLNGLYFCILDSYSNKIDHFKRIEFEKRLSDEDLLGRMVNEFESEPALNKTFQSVKVIYDNDLSVIVPQALFDENHLADYLKFNARMLKHDYISHDPIKVNDSVCVYIPFMNINNFLVDRFGAVDYCHFSSLLVESLLKAEKNLVNRRMYVNVSPGVMHIVVIDQNSLILYNSFEYTTKEDFIYYILFTAEQLELNPESVALILFGHLEERDEFYKMAYKYIRHVEMLPVETEIEIEEVIKDAVLREYVLLNSF